MQNSRVLLISVLLGIFAVFLVYSHVQKREKELLEMSSPVEVVIAARDIPEGSRLDESLVEIIEVPKKFVQPEALSDPKIALNRVVSVPVLRGTQILGSMLGTSDTSSLARKIPKDKLAFSVAVNNVTGIAGLIQPGDFVDILVTVEVGDVGVASGGPNSNADTEVMSKVVLENILVLAVDQRSHRSRVASITPIASSGPGNVFSSSSSGASDGYGNSITTATLAVNNNQILPLTLAQEIGSISLTLRSAWPSEQRQNYSDDKLGAKELLGVKKTVVPRSPAWVEIRGTQQIGRY